MTEFFSQSCTAKIITLNNKETVRQWYDRQTDQPIAVVSASLYVWDNEKKKYLPVGLIFEKGQLICGEGNALGFGYTTDGPWEFATCWAKRWDDYITGYAMVQGGTVVPNPTVYYGDDRNLYLNKHLRLAIGRDKDNRLMVIASDKAVTLADFKAYCVTVGAVDAINLDGGGSRHFILNGEEISEDYTSTRYPYNIIALYDEKSTQIETVEALLKVKCVKKTSTYTVDGKLESNRYIDVNDICTLTLSVNDKIVVPIIYPSGSNTRSAYIKDLANFQQV